MKSMNGLVTAFALAASLVAAPALAQPVIEDITFSSQPGSKFEVRLDFSEPPPADFSAYTIEEPARIAIDFPNTESALDQKRFPLPYGNATGVLVLEAGDRTRMVVNLVKLVPYEALINGNQLIFTGGPGQQWRLCQGNRGGRCAGDPDESRGQRALSVDGSAVPAL